MVILEKSRILVTGACGSVGSAIVEKLIFESHTVCAFDKKENGLFILDHKYKSKYKDSLRLFIGDIRDSNRLLRAFEDVEIVFHCAALKHVYLSEYNPFETVKTNIIGSQNVIEACLKNNVKKVVALSTDNASSPVNLYGATKLTSDKLFKFVENEIDNGKAIANHSSQSIL